MKSFKVGHQGVIFPWALKPYLGVLTGCMCRCLLACSWWWDWPSQRPSEATPAPWCGPSPPSSSRSSATPWPRPSPASALIKNSRSAEIFFHSNSFFTLNFRCSNSRVDIVGFDRRDRHIGRLGGTQKALFLCKIDEF